MATPTEACECDDDDCEVCHEAVRRVFEDLQNESESQYQKILWGPDGIFSDPNSEEGSANGF